MTNEFLKEQNISLTNIWVCQDLRGNVRTVDLKQLLEDYHKWKVKKLNIPDVSGSFDENDIKWIIYYGYTKDKRIFLDEEISGLSYFLEDAFRGNKTLKIFGEIFWNRIRKLVQNYR